MQEHVQPNVDEIGPANTTFLPTSEAKMVATYSKKEMYTTTAEKEIETTAAQAPDKVVASSQIPLIGEGHAFS